MLLVSSYSLGLSQSINTPNFLHKSGDKALHPFTIPGPPHSHQLIAAKTMKTRSRPMPWPFRVYRSASEEGSAEPIETGLANTLQQDSAVPRVDGEPDRHRHRAPLVPEWVTRVTTGLPVASIRTRPPAENTCMSIATRCWISEARPRK